VTDKFLVQPKVEIDAPVIITESTTATGAIRELADTTSSTAIDSVSGTIAFKDVDLNDAHTVGQSAPTFEWSGGTLSEDQKAALTAANTLTLTETDSSGTGFGSVAWTHSAADGAFDFLAKGETLTVQYNVTVDDGHGGPAASQAVTITITGANDAPAVSAAITSTASEDAAPYSVNLLTGASDPDSSDVLHVDANSVSGLAAGVTLNGDTPTPTTIWRWASTPPSRSNTTWWTATAARWRRARPSPSPAPTMRRRCPRRYQCGKQQRPGARCERHLRRHHGALNRSRPRRHRHLSAHQQSEQFIRD
jgi:VCBS repeat-containing protein